MTAVSLPAGTEAAALTGAIDFQTLYDQAGIPNTDEVEALERFLGGLDSNLPDASKLAAAKAFLGAIGKAPSDVITDSGRKIEVVRAVADAKRADTEKAVGERQAAINELQRQIDEQRAAIEGMQKDLESVRSQCVVEESRLQGARDVLRLRERIPRRPGRRPQALAGPELAREPGYYNNRIRGASFSAANGAGGAGGGGGAEVGDGLVGLGFEVGHRGDAQDQAVELLGQLVARADAHDVGLEIVEGFLQRLHLHDDAPCRRSRSGRAA